jgi:hypothetical protein
MGDTARADAVGEGMIGLASRRCRQPVAVLLGCLALAFLGVARAAADDKVRTGTTAGDANTPAPAAGQEPLVPQRPSGPVPAAAYAVLERHCARCHQAGRLQQPRPGETFANILALDEIARDPALVRPGVPDASALYTVMLRRAMPPDLLPGEKSAETGLGPEEVQAVRDWIEGLPEGKPAPVQAGGAPGSAVLANDPIREQRRALDLMIRSDKEAYASGDLVTFFARANADCHLTLIGVDGMGMATVLFPNEFEQNNLLQAGQELRVPGEHASYQFRAKEKGRETLVGVCTVGAKIADGIRQDYERQWFTTLGDWRMFLKRALTGGSPEPRRGRRKGRGRAEAKSAEPVRPEHHARTAITYEVN